jgi:hypothetical protein
MKNALALAVLAAFAANAVAWNDKGHMVVARLAWNKLTPDERTAVFGLLKKHPNYDDFLAKGRPASMTEDEWVFLRAATWADWIKSGPAAQRKYNDPTAHFINLPFVQKGSKVKPPELGKVDVVEAIGRYKLKATAGGSGEEVAVGTAFLFHLVGDIHQPLHCFTLFNDDFTTDEGDRGGTWAKVRLTDGARPLLLHGFWDGLLGRVGKHPTRAEILSTVKEVEDLAKDNDALKKDLADHKTPKEWAAESFALARDVAYLNGTLKPANYHEHAPDASAPTMPEGYAKSAGETARYCVAKAGGRLAEVLREVIAKNAPKP